MQKKGYGVSGAQCSKGKKYAEIEMKDPRRTFTSTVKVNNGEIKLMPVRTDRPIKKGNWKKAIRIIKKLELEAPVNFGSIIIKDFTNTGINLISTRKIEEA